MGDSLSDAQRRIERERKRLAQYREKEAADARHQEKYGPKIVTGPDGVPVRLEVVTSGLNYWRDPPPFLSHPRATFGTRAVGGLTPGLGPLVGRRGFVLQINAYGVHRRVFVREEDAAAALFLRAVREVEQGGLAGLRTLTAPKDQR